MLRGCTTFPLNQPRHLGFARRVREVLPPTFEEALQAAISSRQAAAAAGAAAPAATRYRRVQVGMGIMLACIATSVCLQSQCFILPHPPSFPSYPRLRWCWGRCRSWSAAPWCSGSPKAAAAARQMAAPTALPRARRGSCALERTLRWLCGR